MGVYGTTCINEKCKAPALFFSFAMWVECSVCRARFNFLWLLKNKMSKHAESK